jgi:hypothetical protein
MAFSELWQFMPGDNAGRERWLLEHYLEHQQFYRALLEETPSVASVNLPLQRMDDPQEWLTAHQQVSQSVWSGAGGGQSTDFGTLDWDDPTAVQDWMNVHQLWHEEMRETLGL